MNSSPDVMQVADAYARKLTGTKSSLGPASPLTAADRGIVLALMSVIDAQGRDLKRLSDRLTRLEGRDGPGTTVIDRPS